MLLHLGAAAIMLALALWLASSPRLRGPTTLASAVALALSAAWALADSGAGAASALTRLLFVISNLAWLWVLFRLFSQDERDRSVAPIKAVLAALAMVEAVQILVVIATLDTGMGGLALRLTISLRLLSCVGALVLVHNLYAGVALSARPLVAWPAAALGLIWLYDLNLFTIAYLANAMPAFLAEFRPLPLLVSGLLLLIGHLRHETALRFRPSRSFAFQSFSLLLIGGYLAVMVLVAQALAYAGREYGALLQSAFLLLAALIALALLPSRKLRAWLRVMVSKHLFQHRYDYRAEWLRFTDTIGRAGPNAPPLRERIVQAVADITDSPAGMLLMPAEDGSLALAACWQWPASEIPAQALSAQAAEFFAHSQFIVDLDHVRRGEQEGEAAAICPAWLLAEERAWAMVPLLHYERLQGVVVLARPPVARQLDWEDFDLLRVVGRQLASYLAEQASQDALSEAQRFDEFNRRMAFVMHDIKNLASQLALLASNAERHAEKPAFRADMILTLRKSTDKLQALLARLGRYGAAGSLQCEPIDLEALLGRVTRRYAGLHEIVLTQSRPLLAHADADALEQALVHLVQNAIEASAPDAPVMLSLDSDGMAAQIEVRDCGSGMSAEFVRTRLFRPFHSTKPGGFGIGAFEARELIRAMSGRLDVESREGLGTRFVIHLPLAALATRPAQPDNQTEFLQTRVQ